MKVSLLRWRVDIWEICQNGFWRANSKRRDETMSLVIFERIVGR